ncbi:MAG: 3-keto-5-aminohexanoate cleavage protein [Boseongicola sp. SB0675_bin_26]|nr:3-keto-5-aminohexanoate cleavage protein [Boseongicola sp. SB0675_bin_26]
MTPLRPLPRLMVAPNGARRGKADHRALPITLEETVATAVACQEAGADGLHLHVRDKEGKHSLDTGLYREAIAALEHAVPDLFLQVTSEAAGRYSAGAQRAMIRELRPPSVSVALREMLRARTETQNARAFYAWAHAEGVDVQHIVYSAQELNWLLECIDQKVVPGTHHQLQLVLGSYAGSVLPSPGDLEAYLVPLNARKADLTFDWMVCAFGSAETACLAHAATLGGKVRVGFENSLWNADGSLARDNAARVAEVRAVLNETASVDEAGLTVYPRSR